jgi:predicted RND superfamily exporter protein
MLCVAVFFTTYIPTMEVKMASEDFLFENDPVRAAYDQYKEEFGQDQIAMLTVEPPEVFDLGFLEKLRAFHGALEDEVPHLEEVTSLINVRSVYGRGDELVVEDLLDEMPSTAAELEALRDRVLSTPSYVSRGVISEDGSATTVLVEVATFTSKSGSEAANRAEGSPDEAYDPVTDDLSGFGDEAPLGESLEDALSSKRPFLTGEENSQVIRAINHVIERYDAPDFKIHAAGGTMMTHELTLAMSRDVPRFFGGGLLVMVLVLYVLFRRLAPVFLCILVVVPATLTTFGVAAFVGIPFSTASQLIPSFLLSVGVGYTVHLVTIFVRSFSECHDRVDALEYALRHSGPPILMTGLTTATGVLSFLAAQMKPIVEMGLLAALGVAVTLVFSMVFLPALLVLFPISPERVTATPRIDAFLGAMAVSSARHPRSMVVATLLLTIGAIGAMTLLRVSSEPTIWFPAEHRYRVASDYINDHFGGTSNFEILVDSKTVNGLHEPELLNRIAGLDDVVAQLRERGAKLTHTSSIVDIAKETHQALNANDPAYYAIPQDRRLLAQEFLLFENGGSEDLEKVVDSQFSRTHFTIRSTWRDGIYFERFILEADPLFREKIGPSAEVSITGMSAVMSRTVSATTESMLRSYALALAMITPLMVVLIGSLRAGLVSMVPNLVPILLTLGMMGLTDIPIDMFTLLAGCIAIGLAVDDSIHFIASFRRYVDMGHDPVRAVEETMQSTGRALLFTSIVLTSGFLILMLSGMLNLQHVGALTAFAITTAFLLDVTVTPALLVLVHRDVDSRMGPIDPNSSGSSRRMDDLGHTA